MTLSNTEHVQSRTRSWLRTKYLVRAVRKLKFIWWGNTR